MSDEFDNYVPGLESPGELVERSTHTAADFTFTKVTRGITCSAAGTLTVDTPRNTNVAIQVFAGWNPCRIVKIYDTGSDAITVDGWS